MMELELKLEFFISKLDVNDNKEVVVLVHV